jgi:hypothetical protein
MRKPPFRSSILASLVIASVVGFCAQLMAQSAAGTSTLTVGGDVVHPLVLSQGDFAKLPRATVAYSEHGPPVSYEGVLLYEVLKRAGAPLDDQLKGPTLASYVLAQARDGYQVVLTLTEIDPAFTDNKVLIADTADGKPLGATQAPFRIVIPNEKKAARSIRMLERLTVVRLRK